MSVADITVARMSVSVISDVSGCRYDYDMWMARWKPDSPGRLEQAALALFGERGYDNTTVAEIAAHAGVTERTFFRHYADKREVLFGGAGVMKKLLVSTVAGAPDSAGPIEAAAAGLEAMAEVLQGRQAFARQRQAVIAANTELREREVVKLTSWAGALAETLRARGVSEPAASLTGELAMAVFRVAFERWVDPASQHDLAHFIGESLDEVKAVTADRLLAG